MRLFAADAFPRLAVQSGDLPRPWVMPAGLPRGHRDRLAALLAQALRALEPGLALVQLRWDERRFLHGGGLVLPDPVLVWWRVARSPGVDAAEVLVEGSRVTPGLALYDLDPPLSLGAEAWLGPLKMQVLHRIQDRLLDDRPVLQHEAVADAIGDLSTKLVSPIDLVDAAEALVEVVTRGEGIEAAKAEAVARVVGARFRIESDAAVRAIVTLGRGEEVGDAGQEALCEVGLADAAGVAPLLDLLRDAEVARRTLLRISEHRGLPTLLPERAPRLRGPTPHDLPPRRLFVGRKEELQRLEDALRTGRRTSIAQAAVWGLGGVGKTALALEYAHRALEAGTYPGGVFWVLAEGRPLDAMTRLAMSLGKHAPEILPDLPAGTPVEEIAKAARIALEALDEPSLLVLDNVSEAGFVDLLPRGKARILITTRDRSLAVGKAVPLDVLAPKDAREVATEIAGKKPRGKAESEAFGRVIDGQLGRLAVAVEVAAHAVREWAGSWREYEKLLAREMEKALGRSRDRSRSYPRGAIGALDLSLDQCGEAARRLLEGAAVFAPDAVPIAWAFGAAGLKEKGAKGRQALKEIEGRGLVKVEREAGVMSVHRLVHRRVRDRAEGEGWKAAGERAVELVANWIEKAQGPAKENMDAVEARGEHVVEALAAAERMGNVQRWSHIANGLGKHLWYRGEHAEARSLFERALAIDEEVYGPEHPRVAARLGNLGHVLAHIGEADLARPMIERALRINEKTYGTEHPEVATCLWNLATIQTHSGQPAEARPMLERALAIDEKTYGPEHPEVASDLSNLAIVLRDLGDADLARQLAERAVAISEKGCGPDHPQVARCLSILADVLVDMGEAANALPLAERALRIREKALPPTHPDVDHARRILADVQQALPKP